MKEEVRRWWEQAKQDLKVAQDNFGLRHYEYAAFLCQQSVEKALKAVLLNRSGHIRKIHDLVALGKDVRLPAQLLQFCTEMTQAYVFARYPDVAGATNIKESAADFLMQAKEILKWTEKQLS